MRRPPPNRARLVRALRAFAALVAVVLVGAQLTSIGHHVLVAHYLCAEHGTLHHGRAPEARALERLSGQTAAPVESGDHGVHDDCCFPARTPAELAPVAPVELVTTSAEGVWELERADSPDAHDNIPLLARAPKLSPPES